MFYGGTEQITPNQRSASDGARCELWELCQVREGIAQFGAQHKTKGGGSSCDVISSRIIFDRVEKSGV